ncbi:High mobility group, superfamily [Cordyceps fumosorosea ARSEF 2679]|uniref:High mobility group, superfamily n=1 Tax=Cordyceps fumosorosea (strain ARSEF 2679) TaxID=1081104 RepID=A0A168B1B4_CORFA|nr:High mobility group, superfamily [Cordyceps fumosorosea ARSEF 2679]OAA69480.1 High mobility group, superfamily [Cordyceps fumosorosea ARSEF 2679]
MPRELESVFAELGLAQYLDAFVDQGFDSWDTILDIQESDLDALGVKLGHRRKLQRRIANARGIAPSVSLVSTLKSGSEDAKQQPLRRESATRSEAGSESTNGVTKRKYRRHPKPDENAPERPPSAYVLFSNKMREDLKSHNLSFTEIAKLVGENWQNLDQAERELYENQANAAKEKYRRNLVEYKKTSEYRRYAQYLQDFKEKQNKHNQGSKAHLRKNSTAHTALKHSATHPDTATDTSTKQRVDSKRDAGRLRHDSSHGSTTSGGTSTTLLSGASGTISGSSSERLRESEPPPYRRRRVDSIASIAESQMSSTAPTALSHRNSLDGNGLSPRDSHFDNNSPIDGRHSQHSSAWYDRSNPSEASKMPHQLPSLSDMFEKDNHQGIGGRLPPAGSSATGMGSPIPYQTEDVVRRSGGSKLPDSRPTGDSALPIHALLSNQASSNPLYAKAPLRGSHMLNSKDTVEPALGPPGYGFLSNSPTFRHMKTEQSGDGDVVMTTERSPPSSGGEKGRFDGMSALLQAGEIVGRRGDRR